MNIFICNSNCQRFFFQTLTMAGFTRCDPHKTLVLCLAGLGERLPVTAVHVLDQALKGHVVNAGSALSCIVDLYFLSTGSVDQDIMDLLRIIFKRSIKIKAILCRQGIQNRPRKASPDRWKD